MKETKTDKRIILTGGGTAGHVTPNLALLPYLKEAGFEVAYIGSDKYIESQLVPDEGIPYYGISTGMLRRYSTIKNLTDPFRVLKGICQAKRIIKQYRPNIIFSKGGFVGLPVAYAAFLCRIPVIIHESDMTPGLANKLSMPVAKRICCNFPETVKKIRGHKAILTGSPLRDELLSGDAATGRKLCGFKDSKPVVLVIGGSLGASSINKAIREALPTLLEDFNIIHICGQDKLDASIERTEGYKQFEYVTNNLNHLFALADLVVSRAGANSICEILALRKPNILIPLSKATRGDQILNAASFEAQGYSMILKDDECNAASISERITELYFLRQTYIDNMTKSSQGNAIKLILEVIRKYMK